MGKASSSSRLKRLCALCAAAVLEGCGLFEADISVEVRLPPPPRRWSECFRELRFTLSYPDGDGEFRERRLEDWSPPVRVSLTKRANAPILAYPWSPGDFGGIPRGVLCPAGALSSLCTTGDDGAQEISLCWEDGPLAEVFLFLWKSGIDPGRVNARRLAGYMRKSPDPWSWDVKKIAERLAAGDFRAYDVDRLPASDVRLSGFEGEWFFESPFSPSLCPDSGGVLEIAALPYGAHTLFSVRGESVGLFVDGRGPVAGVR
jgi:hypothetical protein